MACSTSARFSSRRARRLRVRRSAFRTTRCSRRESPASSVGTSRCSRASRVCCRRAIVAWRRTCRCRARSRRATRSSVPAIKARRTSRPSRATPVISINLSDQRVGNVRASLPAYAPLAAAIRRQPVRAILVQESPAPERIVQQTGLDVQTLGEFLDQCLQQIRHRSARRVEWRRRAAERAGDVGDALATGPACSQFNAAKNSIRWTAANSATRGQRYRSSHSNTVLSADRRRSVTRRRVARVPGRWSATTHGVAQKENPTLVFDLGEISENRLAFSPESLNVHHGAPSTALHADASCGASTRSTPSATRSRTSSTRRSTTPACPAMSSIRSW